MPAALAAGIVLYRIRGGGVEILLGHLGGPYFARKDKRGWVVPKGLVEAGEGPLDAARREWTEETGQPAPEGVYVPLPLVKQSSSKHTLLWAVRGDVDAGCLYSNSFALEWPPRSGTRRTFPEVDRYIWCGCSEARELLVAGLASVPEILLAALGHK